MRAANFRDEVLYAAAIRCGIDPRTNLLRDQVEALVVSINTWLRRFYERFDWPEWTGTEIRQPDPTTHLVPLTSETGTEIGKVFRVYLRDPALHPGPLETPFKLRPDGVHVGFEHGTNVWIKSSPPAPKFTGEEYDVTIAYPAGAIAYDPTTGSCYRALVGGAGHALGSATYWQLIPFPAVLADAVVRGAYADALREEGKADAAAAEEQAANAEAAERAGARYASDFDAMTDQARPAPRYRALKAA